MILKFRCPVWPDGRQPWMIVDQVESVVFVHGKTSKSEITDNIGDGAGATYLCIHDSDETQNIISVECTVRGNQYSKYVFSTEGYLCNDNGQTIERLIP